MKFNCTIAMNPESPAEAAALMAAIANVSAGAPAVTSSSSGTLAGVQPEGIQVVNTDGAANVVVEDCISEPKEAPKFHAEITGAKTISAVETAMEPVEAGEPLTSEEQRATAYKMIETEGYKVAKSTTDGSGGKLVEDDPADLNGTPVIVMACARGRAVVADEDGRLVMVASPDLNVGDSESGGERIEDAEIVDVKKPAAESAAADEGAITLEMLREVGKQVQMRVSPAKAGECIRAGAPKAQRLSDAAVEDYPAIMAAFKAALEGLDG